MPKVLIADDEPGIRSLVRLALDGAVLEVIEAASGGEALARARKEVPDLILLDLSMPVMNGIDVCRALRQEPATKGIIVVMLTAHADAGYRDEGTRAGADAYLIKPFAPLELVELVHDLLAPRAVS